MNKMEWLKADMWMYKIIKYMARHSDRVSDWVVIAILPIIVTWLISVSYKMDTISTLITFVMCWLIIVIPLSKVFTSNSDTVFTRLQKNYYKKYFEDEKL